MDDKPLVSIALCTYKGEKFLREQLNSLILQDYPNIEIVIVDDKSTDNTVEIIKEYEQKHDNIFVHVNDTNLGFTKNFEKAVGLCQGEYIALCDQDDIWDYQKISKQFLLIADNIFIYHDSEFIQENGVSMNKNMSDVVNFYRGDRPEAFLFFNCVSGHSIFMKKELLNYALPLPSGFFHDWWLAYVATNVGKINYLNQSLVKYRQHENSDTNILQLERRKKDNYSTMSIAKIKKDFIWLKKCSSYKYNKDNKFVNKIALLHEKYLVNYINIRYTSLLINNIDILYFIQKKTKTYKIRSARKKFWGLKAKNFWYKWIKCDPAKIVE